MGLPLLPILPWQPAFQKFFRGHISRGRDRIQARPLGPQEEKKSGLSGGCAEQPHLSLKAGHASGVTLSTSHVLVIDLTPVTVLKAGTMITPLHQQNESSGAGERQGRPSTPGADGEAARGCGMWAGVAEAQGWEVDRPCGRSASGV